MAALRLHLALTTGSRDTPLFTYQSGLPLSREREIRARSTNPACGRKNSECRQLLWALLQDRRRNNGSNGQRSEMANPRDGSLEERRCTPVHPNRRRRHARYGY